MNYQQFLEYREEMKLQYPNLLDLADSNLYQYFSKLEISSEISVGHKNGKVYRCHLVEDYLKAFYLPIEWKSKVGASQGVRQSLTVLFSELNDWIIPQDVYPFYADALVKAGKEHKTYQTLIDGNIFTNIPNGTLLVTYPLKPKGMDLNPHEWQALRDYVKKDKNNYIVFDLVYWTKFNFPKEVIEIPNDQVVILHSLSKMFLIPNHFGVAILPSNSLGQTLREKFKGLQKDEMKLQKAYNALHHFKTLPDLVKIQIQKNINFLNTKNILIPKSEEPTYLFYTKKSHMDWLKDGVLTIPESVFGGTGSGSILSVLIQIQ